MEGNNIVPRRTSKKTIEVEDKQLRDYELVLIINPEVEGEGFDAIIENVNQFVTGNGGSVSDVERWGKRRLTYPIEPPQQGGLPIVPFPPMAILAFETMILIAFIASISGFAILTRMQRSKSKVYDHLLTVDRFAIGLVDLNDESMTAAIEIFKQNHTEDIDEFFEAKPNKSQELREI